MAEDVHVRVRDRADHARGHRVRAHPELGVHARDDDVELGEQLFFLIECAVVEDVDLDAAQDPQRRELLVQLVDQVELLAEALRAQARARR